MLFSLSFYFVLVIAGFLDCMWSLLYISSYIKQLVLLQDDRIQDILGQYQKDFEGGVSADTLGE